MPIRVLVDTINKETLQKILDYYNEHKEDGENPLERAQAAEGGFEIQRPQEEWKINPYTKCVSENDKVRQLRWKNGYLNSYGYTSFTAKQSFLLYDALVFALPGQVVLE
jgi:hypothetical protein